MVQPKILALSFSPGACGVRRSSQSGVQKQKAGRDDVVREAHLHAIEQCERTRMLVSSRLSILWTGVVQAILVGFARGWESWKGWLTPLSHLNGRAMNLASIKQATTPPNSPSPSTLLLTLRFWGACLVRVCSHALGTLPKS